MLKIFDNKYVLIGMMVVGVLGMSISFNQCLDHVGEAMNQDEACKVACLQKQAKKYEYVLSQDACYCVGKEKVFTVELPK